MKLNTLLEYLLNEAKKPAKVPPEPPEAPADAPLGQYLFATARKDVPKPKEPNTELENTLMKDLNRHFAGEGNVNLIDASLTTLMGFEKQGLYPKLLKPPSGLAYRFMSNVSVGTASSIFLDGLDPEIIMGTSNKAFCVEPIGVIENPAYKSTVGRGTTKAASWTIAPEGYNFGDFTVTRAGSVAILLVADIASNDNFLLNPNNIADYAQENVADFDASLIKKEREVISIGPVNVLKTAYMYVLSDMPTIEPKVFNNMPTINTKTLHSIGKIEKEEFKPIYDYVNDCIQQYGSKLPKDRLTVIKSLADYKFLKLCAEQGLDLNNKEGLAAVSKALHMNLITKSAAERNLFYHFTHGASNILERIQAELKKNDKYATDYNRKAGLNIQKALLKAVGVKVKVRK